MKQKLVAIIAIALLAVTMIGCSGITAGSSMTPSSALHAHRIVCVGDSLTQGGAGVHNDWPYQLKGRLGGDWEVVNQGMGGWKTADILAHINSALTLKPHFVIIMGGVNDLAHGPVPLATTQANIKAMSTRVESSGAVPVLCTVTPIGYNSPQRNTLNAWITKYAHSKGYPLIDFNKVLENPSKPGNSNTALMTSDGIHPTPAGITAMANAIDLGIFTGGASAVTHTPSSAETSTATATSGNQSAGGIQLPGFEVVSAVAGLAITGLVLLGRKYRAN